MEESLHQRADELLTAFDKVANSNSHLLQAPPREGSLQQRFLRFARSRAFRRVLCESDLKRDWHNLNQLNHKMEWVPKPGGFYNGRHIEFLELQSGADFAQCLGKLLNEGPCWYGKRYPRDEVGRIVREFLLSFPPDQDLVQVVKPDFLHSNDYLGLSGGAPENERALCYFDGCGADHCWCWLSKGELFVLLLNGSS